MDAMIVVDMQVGLLDGAPKHDLQGVIQRINSLTADYHVVVVSDGHTVSDRPHLDAVTVIRHHHWVWSDLITDRSVRIMTTSQLIDECAG
jgi:nicotinamidase-related amidase